jgi:hypothetical protein
MDYASLEDAYGSAFGQRAPVTHKSSTPEQGPLQPSKSIDQRAAESIEKHKGLIESVKKTIGYDTDPESESYKAPPPPPPREKARETFASSQPANITTDFNQTEKLSRILRLIEQNKTGYERPAIQDMLLYIATGVVFLFTFDTFVVLGKSMRGK